MQAPTIMVVGTGSSVGKSLIVAGLCRWLHRQGLKVAPFKSQNMALNSFVTPKGKEIGTAQAMQAAAAGIEPTVAINPILLKPEGQRRSQVIVNGEAIGSMSATEYHAYKPQLRQVVADALAELRQTMDVVVIEGAGSPVEMNLKSHDIVNMFVAELADAQVIIVGDIDKGGIFASLIGTYDLLTPSEQQRVAGFVINKFRGDPALLGDGLEFIHHKTGVPVLGVLPMLEGLTLPDEDGHLLGERLSNVPRSAADTITVGIVRFPRMSNFDEFALLRQTPGVSVKLIDSPAQVLDCHLLILPGSKQTAADLGWVRERGLEDAIVRRFDAQLPMMAICGGFQMLGLELVDKLGMESPAPLVVGVGLLPLRTVFASTKTLRQVQWRVSNSVAGGDSPPDPPEGDLLRGGTPPPGPPGLLAGLKGTFSGYEIHCGNVFATEPLPPPPIEVAPAASEQQEVLAVSAGRHQKLFGTLVHGVLSHQEAIACLLANVRQSYFLPPAEQVGQAPSYDQSYDALADALDQHLELDKLITTK